MYEILMKYETVLENTSLQLDENENKLHIP